MKKILNQLLVLCGLAVALSSCHDAEVVNISQPLVTTANAITSENLSGAIKGTLLAGKTYYFSSDLTINDGDTVLMQPGVTLIAKGDGKTPATAPEIFNYGTFISLGTKENPNYITVQNAAALKAEAATGKYENAQFGWWGGITCTPAPVTTSKPNPKGGDLILKWTHVEFGGGPAGPGDNQAFYKTGSARYNIYFANIEKNMIIEDCWFYGAKDDNIRTDGGKISVMRNTFEFCGNVGGEFLNMKSGTVGDVAYNMCIGSATNSLKASNSGGTAIQCNVNMYNNTMVNGGFRQTKTGRGGGINYEQTAKGKIFNNLFVNCRFSLRITADADLPNITFGNNLFYGSQATIIGQFYAIDSSPTLVKATTDIISNTPGANDPMFYSYDKATAATFFATANNGNGGPYTPNLMPYGVINMGNSNFRLQAGSPAIGRSAALTPLHAVTATGTYGANITPPGADLGAYQTNGTGNQH